MRWLLAMLIALFCWTGSVSGQKLYAAQLTFTPSAFSCVIDQQVLAPTAQQSALRPLANLQRKAPGKLPLLLPRVHSYSCSLFSFAALTPAYALAEQLGERKPSRQPAIAPNRLHQVNWTLHSSRQQSRIGGWKESNMLYRGSLTYHS